MRRRRIVKKWDKWLFALTLAAVHEGCINIPLIKGKNHEKRHRYKFKRRKQLIFPWPNENEEIEVDSHLIYYFFSYFRKVMKWDRLSYYFFFSFRVSHVLAQPNHSVNPALGFHTRPLTPLTRGWFTRLTNIWLSGSQAQYGHYLFFFLYGPNYMALWLVIFPLLLICFHMLHADTKFGLLHSAKHPSRDSLTNGNHWLAESGVESSIIA